MSLQLRPGRPEDASECGRICYEAFATISAEHNFPRDFPDAEVATGMMGMLLANEGYHVVVAESDGRIVGSNGVDERGIIAGIGPITVDPRQQNAGAGRALMQYVLDRERRREAAGVRLVQAAYHNRSLSLYTKLGFDTREPLSCIQGDPPANVTTTCQVRPGADVDIVACAELCLRVHGHERTGEVRDALAMGMLMVVEREGRIGGYTTGVGFLGHTVAETNTELKALIAAAPGYWGPGFLLPTRNSEVLRWCLQHGLRVVQPMTLMSIGLYNEPRGAWLPSIGY
ncbi:MAG TPA: GNAT family N-acetyltransferase [Candidatus Limnocylindrales bacterium]|nr:GNAT family N-acetyltransferase [Candidatus Limnocylindrales bacterium]